MTEHYTPLNVPCTFKQTPQSICSKSLVLCVYVCVYIYIYFYTHQSITQTSTPRRSPYELARLVWPRTAIKSGRRKNDHTSCHGEIPCRNDTNPDTNIRTYHKAEAVVIKACDLGFGDIVDTWVQAPVTARSCQGLQARFSCDPEASCDYVMPFRLPIRTAELPMAKHGRQQHHTTCGF